MSHCHRGTCACHPRYKSSKCLPAETQDRVYINLTQMLENVDQPRQPIKSKPNEEDDYPHAKKLLLDCLNCRGYRRYHRRCTWCTVWGGGDSDPTLLNLSDWGVLWCGESILTENSHELHNLPENIYVYLRLLSQVRGCFSATCLTITKLRATKKYLVIWFPLQWFAHHRYPSVEEASAASSMNPTPESAFASETSRRLQAKQEPFPAMPTLPRLPNMEMDADDSSLEIWKKKYYCMSIASWLP